MPRLRRKVYWAPSDDPSMRRGPSGRKTLLIVAIIVAGWIAFASLAVIIEPDGSLQHSGQDIANSNVVEVTNDSSEPVYFVPCDDLFCNETPDGTNPGNFNLVTTGHFQRMHLAREDKGEVTLGVFNDGRILQGCIQLEATKRKQPTVSLALSSALHACGISQYPRNEAGSSSNPPSTIPVFNGAKATAT